MGLTSIGDQRTPGRPTEITFGPLLGLPSATQTLTLIGHAASGAASGTVAAYAVQNINNAASATSAKAEAEGYFGAGSELSKMVIAAINAIAQAGGSNFPTIKAIPLKYTDTDFGGALTALNTFEAELVVSPYDAASGSVISPLTTALQNQISTMSGAQRVNNGQYGSIGVAFNRAQTNPSNLAKPDTQYLTLCWMRDSATGAQAPAYSVGEAAAAYAAVLAANPVPFNPVDTTVIGGLVAPALQSDWVQVGAGMESETALQSGWTPLRVLPNGSVAVVRAITARITTGDDVTPATSYYDVPDFQVLYYWRKTLVTRFNQPDLVKVKASNDTAKLLLSEMIRLAQSFEDNGMFQNVSALAKLFQVVRSQTDRHRFDVFTPVNVIPGLHVIATNIQTTTVGDTLTL